MEELLDVMMLMLHEGLRVFRGGAARRGDRDGGQGRGEGEDVAKAHVGVASGEYVPA